MVSPRKRGSGSHWSDGHIQFLKDWYGKMPINRLSKVLTRRCRAIHLMAWKLGLCKRRYRTDQISQERYEKTMTLTAIFHGVAPRHMFRDLRHHEGHLSIIKFGAWAELHAEGVSQSSIAKAAGVDHTSVRYGCLRHAQIMAQQSEREAAE